MRASRYVQQPDDDASVFALPPAVPEEAEGLVKLAHGVVVPEFVAPTVMLETPGVGTVISGLAPAVLVSTAPSGTLPPFRVKLELAPGVETEEAVPVVDADCEDAQLEAELADPAALNPPPSKVEPTDVVDVMLLVPGVCEFEELLALQVELAKGLRPPGSISVAPSGMPVPLVPLLLPPSEPSGEVVPHPDEVMEVCALAIAQPQNSTIAAIDNRGRMEILWPLRLFLRRSRTACIGSTRCKKSQRINASF